MIRPLIPAFAFALLVSSGCSLPKDTAAEVNGRPIPTAEFESEYRKFLSEFGQVPPALEPSLPKVRRGLLERLVDRELMLQDAGRRGIRATAAEIDQAFQAAHGGMLEPDLDATLSEAGLDRERWRQSVERDLIIEKLQRAVMGSVTVSDREIADWMERHRDRHEEPEQTRAAQILLRTREEAQEARRRILGGTPFATVARELSRSPDAERGGNLGYFSRGQMPPEFDEVLFTLAPGHISDVVETAYGYHLFTVVDRRPARALSDAETAAQVRATLVAEKKEEAHRAWLQDLRNGAKIRYNSKVVHQ